MPIPVETVSAKPFKVEQVIEIVNRVLATGSYKIEEARLAFNDKYPPVEVRGLEKKNGIESNKMFLITDLVTGHRYEFSANTDDGSMGFEAAGMSRLKRHVSIARLPMLRVDEIYGGWTHWYLLPPEESEVDIEGELDPLLYSIVSRLRQ